MEEAEEEVTEDEVEARWASYSAVGRRSMVGGICMMTGRGWPCPGSVDSIFPPPSPSEQVDLWLAVCECV